MQPHNVVSREAWIAARKAHLAHEKELTQARERLNEERRALPWVKVDKDYVFDGPGGKDDAGRSVQGAQPARGAALHVCARLERGLQALLVLGRRIRAHHPASCRARYHAGGDLAGAAGKTRRFQGADGLDLRLAVVRGIAISITTTPCRSRRSAIKSGENIYNFGTIRFRYRRRARHQRVLSRRGREHLPYLFLLRARPRHDERRLPLSRSDAARSSRGGTAVSDGLGAAT